MVFKRMEQRRAERVAAANVELEKEPRATRRTKSEPSLEEREEAIAKAESEAKVKAEEAKVKEAEALAAVPPEPVVLPEWQPTVVAKVEEKDKTVGDWIVQGVRAIVDEHKLTSLKAWRDVAGNVQVEYVEDSRAMYALRKK